VTDCPPPAAATRDIPGVREERQLPQSRRLSDILVEVAESGRETVSVSDLLRAVGERSFGALLVVFAMPNVLAGVLPGLSVVLGVPLMLLSLQLLVAADRPWLPARLLRFELRRTDLASPVARIVPHLRRLERALRPRLLLLTGPWAERLAGAACLVLSLMVFLPIPFANLLPAVGIVLFGLAMLERDGLVALAAAAVLGICLVLFGGVVLAVFAASAHALRS
jgi:hypothetical protein